MKYIYYKNTKELEGETEDAFVKRTKKEFKSAKFLEEKDSLIFVFRSTGDTHLEPFHDWSTDPVNNTKEESE